MIHAGFKGLLVLDDGAGLLELQQCGHLAIKFIGAKLVGDSSDE